MLRHDMLCHDITSAANRISRIGGTTRHERLTASGPMLSLAYV